MILFWRIRYLDRSTREFQNRDLVLDTASLEPATKATIELLIESKRNYTDQRILNYRHLFVEDDLDSRSDWVSRSDCGKFVTLHEYFEDETGKPITPREMGPTLTGDPNAVLVRAGTKQHEVDLMLAEPKPTPLAEVTLTPEDLKLLGYFVRDFEELSNSALMKNGPGRFHFSPNRSLETAVSDDEIRSFVTIFRRLYMENERASFLKAVGVYVQALGDHPFARWTDGAAKEYQGQLNAAVSFLPFAQGVTFTRKRLIDVFIYTQYAHQPSERRQRQYTECLNEVAGDKLLLTWMFLSEVWGCAIEIGNVGRVIVAWFHRYCEYHEVTADILPSLSDDLPGLGKLEKDEDRQMRLLRKKSEQLATDIWKQNGCPPGGPMQFLHSAQQQLRDVVS